MSPDVVEFYALSPYSHYMHLIRRLWHRFRSRSDDTEEPLMSEETDDLKDAYAQFGLTFSHGCNVEGILASLILTSDFVKMVVTESKKAGKPIYSPRVRKLDEYRDKQLGKTMGQLIGGPKRPGGVKDFIQLDPAIEKRVDDALRRRNYLAHDFWRERGMEMISVKRRNIVCCGP